MIDHPICSLLCEEVIALKISGNDLVEAFFRSLQYVASFPRRDACVVDQYIQPSERRLHLLQDVLSVRLGEYDIPVYEVRPGVISTDMTSGVKGKYDKLIEEGLCVTRRWGYPDDVGKAVRALASGDFPYSTGQVIMVDGGLTLSRL